MIAREDGTIVARALEFVEELVVADLDLAPVPPHCRVSSLKELVPPSPAKAARSSLASTSPTREMNRRVDHADGGETARGNGRGLSCTDHGPTRLLPQEQDRAGLSRAVGVESTRRWLPPWRVTPWAPTMSTASPITAPTHPEHSKSDAAELARTDWLALHDGANRSGRRRFSPDDRPRRHRRREPVEPDPRCDLMAESNQHPPSIVLACGNKSETRRRLQHHLWRRCRGLRADQGRTEDLGLEGLPGGETSSAAVRPHRSRRTQSRRAQRRATPWP